MKILKAVIIAIMFFILLAEIAYSSYVMTSVVYGTMADLKLDEKQKTIEVYLSDVNTKKTITDASVTAIVRLPGNEKKEITLTGMKMDGVFSYMNSLDTAKKGDYIFRIKVLRGKRELIFNFTFKRE